MICESSAAAEPGGGQEVLSEPAQEPTLQKAVPRGVFRRMVGTVPEERYHRLDNGSRCEHARLKEAWRVSWVRAGGASTVLPNEDGIRRVGNPGGATAISVRLYGPWLGEVGGRDYDPSREYVCDRCPA